MKKVYVYQMHAGLNGTEETFAIVSDTILSPSQEHDYMQDHASSYQEQDEDGEWEQGDPEIWLEAKVSTLTELEEVSGSLLRGRDTFEELVTQLEAEGMVWLC